MSANDKPGDKTEPKDKASALVQDQPKQPAGLFPPILQDK